jgi:hypothetical protein
MDKKEKLFLLDQLVRLAKADNHIYTSEYEFIYTMAQIFEIDKSELESLFDKKAAVEIPEMEYDRITQFYRLVLLSKIDLEMDSNEKSVLINMGNRLGLSPDAVNQVIIEMNQSGDQTLPPQRLIQIFKTHHN